MTDIEEFDKAGKGASTSAGALIYDTVEQLGKAKLGLLPNEWSKTVGTDKLSPEFTKTHKTAIKAEDKVNGNKRKEKKGYFLEKNGTKTKQDLTPNSSGGVDIKKTEIKKLR